MANLNTEIAWTDVTWNPVTGCSKVSQGCRHCYAERIFSRPYPGRKFTDVQTHPDRLTQPLSWQKPKRVFVNSMSDLFHESIPDEFIVQVFAIMALASRHQFQVLTKRPERMQSFVSQLARSIQPLEHAARTMGYTFQFQNLSLLPWPIPNIWLGVSVENQETADERIPLLLKTPAPVRFLSCEPLLGPIDLGRSYPCGYYCDERIGHVDHPFWSQTNPYIAWLIVGGESGPGARPMALEWAFSLVTQCATAKVAAFVKQLGGIRDKRDDIAKFPLELQVREYPSVLPFPPTPAVTTAPQAGLFGEEA